DFIQDTSGKEAAAAFWSDDLKDAPEDRPLIKVEDTEDAFKDVGCCYLVKVSHKIIGSKVSNGKTTTKDMTASVLSQKYKIHKTPGNVNNQIGVSKSLLTMPMDT